jgi:hypothetical protein
VSFGFDDNGSWRLSADALVAVAEGYLAGEALARPHPDRHLVVIHVGADDAGGPTAICTSARPPGIAAPLPEL